MRLLPLCCPFLKVLSLCTLKRIWLDQGWEQSTLHPRHAAVVRTAEAPPKGPQIPKGDGQESTAHCRNDINPNPVGYYVLAVLTGPFKERHGKEGLIPRICVIPMNFGRGNE